ncbi:hypothetical protein CPT_Muenster_087 [Klebsiella phage Muenster]|nr:hypothetical protein CPT_Muenster_087 [Klebsiella phage Muenster]
MQNKYNYNDPEFATLAYDIAKMVKDLKECAIGTKDISTVMNTDVNFKKELQVTDSTNPLAAFKNCVVDFDGVVQCNIGYRSLKGNVITFDAHGNLYEIDIYKGQKLIIKFIDIYRCSISYQFELPKIDGAFIDNYDAYIFQLSTTNEYYSIIDFVLRMKMKFQSNLYLKGSILDLVL